MAAPKKAAMYTNSRSVLSEGNGAASGNVALDDHKLIQNLQNLECVHRDQTIKFPPPLINPEIPTHTTQKSSPQGLLLSLTPEESTPVPAAYANDLIFFSDLDFFELENIGSFSPSFH